MRNRATILVDTPVDTPLGTKSWPRSPEAAFITRLKINLV